MCLRSLFVLVVAALSCWARPSECAPLVSVEGGRGESVDVWGLGVGWDRVQTWTLGRQAEIELYALGRVDHWHGTEAGAVVSDLWDVSATPVVRLQASGDPGPGVFLDIGFGVHLISETRINAHRQFSTVFQFGEFLGPGIRFGSRGQVDLSFRVQHVSNGNIEEPNNGLNFRTLVLQYRFR